ncbi:hypothetical protein NEHOM01_2313 [Nematocida homosporus]|uniref:uncharacterized protein n=1 Tax=Nematocida homosporus TaxID=1912981 RepID=UPI00221EAD7F|nr:uncharacterized protein NEHOM01_2313 [Nematocida homosporus]KAI5187615.1 hypothetical protein NEHOM01_2313 [Nematocida homosporus]
MLGNLEIVEMNNGSSPNKDNASQKLSSTSPGAWHTQLKSNSRLKSPQPRSPIAAEGQPLERKTQRPFCNALLTTIYKQMHRIEYLIYITALNGIVVAFFVGRYLRGIADEYYSLHSTLGKVIDLFIRKPKFIMTKQELNLCIDSITLAWVSACLLITAVYTANFTCGKSARSIVKAIVAHVINLSISIIVTFAWLFVATFWRYTLANDLSLLTGLLLLNLYWSVLVVGLMLFYNRKREQHDTPGCFARVFGKNTFKHLSWVTLTVVAIVCDIVLITCYIGLPGVLLHTGTYIRAKETGTLINALNRP